METVNLVMLFAIILTARLAMRLILKLDELDDADNM